LDALPTLALAVDRSTLRVWLGVDSAGLAKGSRL